MLTNKIDNSINLIEQQNKAKELVKKELKSFFLKSDELFEISYPVIEYPTRVTSIDLENSQLVESKLMGIKGQYLIFEDGNVINIRKHNGYRVEFEF